MEAYEEMMPVEEGEEVVVDGRISSVEELEQLLAAFELGKVAPGASYIIGIASLRVSEAPDLVQLIRRLVETFGVNFTESEYVHNNIRRLARLDDRLTDATKHVDLLLKIFDQDKKFLDADAAKERAEMEAWGFVNEDVLQFRAKQARLRVIKEMAPSLKVLRNMARRATRRNGVWDKDILFNDIYIYCRKTIEIEKFMSSGERTVDWLLGELEALNEVVIPALRDSFASITQ